MKKTALLVSFVMLGMAYAVFFQHASVRSSLRGSLIFPTQTSPTPTCEEETINGILKICCSDPFEPGKRNCTNFAHDFHELCDEKGVECKTVTFNCPSGGHAMNIIQVTEGLLAGKWCLIEPQDDTPTKGLPDYIACADAPEKIPHTAYCKALNIPLNADGTCSCKLPLIVDDPAFPNTDPGICRYRQDNVCVSACLSRRPPEFTEEIWAEVCKITCFEASACPECCGIMAPKELTETEKSTWIDSCKFACEEGKPNAAEALPLPSESSLSTPTSTVASASFR